MNSLALLVAILATVNCQWVYNQTSVIRQGHGPGGQNWTVVNTTVWQNPGNGPVRPGYARNLTQYSPYAGFVNNTAVRRNNGNDLNVGTAGPNDVTLLKQWFNKASRWLQIREKIITYPPYPSANRYLPIITSIGIYDLQNRSGGHATILSGGVGRTNVTIRLFSDRSCSFNFKVVITGR